MLIRVQDLHTKRIGVVDDTSQKVIIPITYSNVMLQKNGIVATDESGMETAFFNNGKAIVRKVYNVLFLNDNYLLLSSQNKGYLLNLSTGKYVFKNPFDAIMVFVGSNEQAIMYGPSQNFSNILLTQDYWQYGIYLENYVCMQMNGKWGVVDLDTHNLILNFEHNVIVHCTNKRIAYRDANNEIRTL